ncbi:hypothetical protein Ato02nite_026480 [Paractinoplanes toevensis]|uniref:Methyl-accepting chemotaxis protein n=2 Tax=Paractinoplanes toevensis TaxID=571911 RepID=A0A919T8A3_9ACTN|nr:hypothetical protein Ato02nite_026480 [Actinoplanes toevensis]
MSDNIRTVAAGAEEMGASIREISLGATKAAEVAARAVHITAATSGVMAKLGESSAEIGNVSVSEAASAGGQVAATINEVASSVQLTSVGVSEAHQAAGRLTRMSAELGHIVARFRL